MTKDPIDSFVAEIDRLSDVCKRLEQACELYRSASVQSHFKHMYTKGSGLNCPECLQARHFRDQADAIMKSLKEDV